MTTKKIIENIKSDYDRTINYYTDAIEAFKKAKNELRTLQQEELKHLSPSPSHYDLAIQAMQKSLNNVIKDLNSVDFEINTNTIEQLDELIKDNDDYIDIDKSLIKTTLEIHFRIKNKLTIKNKNITKLNNLISNELREELCMFSVNELEFELYEVLSFFCSKESIKAIFVALKDSYTARLPKQPKTRAIKLIDTVENIILK